MWVLDFVSSFHSDFHGLYMYFVLIDDTFFRFKCSCGAYGCVRCVLSFSSLFLRKRKKKRNFVFKIA